MEQIEAEKREPQIDFAPDISRGQGPHGLNSRKIIIAAVILSILIAVFVFLPRKHKSDAEPDGSAGRDAVNEIQLLGLTLAEIKGGDISGMASKSGINFSPSSAYLHALHEAGADNLVTAAIISAKRFKALQPESTSRLTALSSLERVASLVSGKLEKGRVPQEAMEALRSAQEADPDELVLGMVEARLFALWRWDL